MDRTVIVGSGASAVHCALSLLRKGHEVLMLDVGRQKRDAISTGDSFIDLKLKLNDPVRYFLGKNFEAVIYPDNDAEYYGFPPSKNYVFSKPASFRFRSNGFSPLFSFAQGGLAEVWTGGVYPLNDEELKDFPFSYEDLEPYYNEVARRIGITGVNDDLTRFYPLHDHLLQPLDLDQHSELLLTRYKKQRTSLNSKVGVFLGRSRVATLSRDQGERKSCNYTGRCIWGCSSQSLYTPSITLAECKQYHNFKYLPGQYVTHFRFNSKRHITHVVAESLDRKTTIEFELNNLMLAAGTLSSSKIFIDSIYKNTGEIIKLRGLMDNRQVFVPYINLQMLGKQYDPNSYQYHQIAMGVEDSDQKKYVHGQITTLKTALMHPIIQQLPFDLKTSTYLFRNIHAALGLVNLNFHDTRRQDNYITIEIDPKSSHSTLLIKYSSSVDENERIKRAIGKVIRALFRLRCIVSPGMIHVRPMGASVHYSGTLPMSEKNQSYTVTESCQSREFGNLFIVDGTTFPFLPAKNLTFTLMANAARVAATAF